MAKSLNSEGKIAAIPSVRNEYTGQIWTIEDVRREVEKVRRLLTQEGYKPGLVRSIAFNPRLTKSCGRTHRFRATFEMDFSVNYFKKSGADSIWDTIAHEVIHTVPGCFNHGEGCSEVSGEAWVSCWTAMSGRGVCQVHHTEKGLWHNIPCRLRGLRLGWHPAEETFENSQGYHAGRPAAV